MGAARAIKRKAFPRVLEGMATRFWLVRPSRPEIARQGPVRDHILTRFGRAPLCYTETRRRVIYMTPVIMCAGGIASVVALHMNMLAQVFGFIVRIIR
jgi:hypothetical protein